jgi:hypothetical protein
MPCYRFTYHAWGSWLPDHPRGYVRRRQGIVPPDRAMAARYRANMDKSAVTFSAAIQRHLIEETLNAGDHQQFRCHYLATEPTHYHTLVSWKTDREWQTVRAKLRASLTRRMNRELKTQQWFSKSPSRKQVRDRRHFDYLIGEYLPRHRGLKWCEGGCIFQ